MRVFVTGVATALTVLSLAMGAQAKDKVIFGNAAPPSFSSAQTAVAEVLGYFEQEGLEVEFRVFAGGANTVAQTVGKQADISFPGNEPVIIGKQPGRDALPVKFFYNATPTVIWELVVPDASPIRTLKDLRGKRIGIFAPSASNVPQVKAILRREGINPETEITMRSIGLGAGALQAMTSGAVDVVALYDVEHATFETQGVKIRRLPVSPVVQQLFSNGLLTQESNLADPRKREILVKVGRAIARATLFCETEPRACVQATWKYYPQLKPTGIDEGKALSDAMHVIAARIDVMKLRDYQNGQYGLYAPDAWQAYVDFMLAEKELQQPVDISTLYTNDLIPEINTFDRDAVIRQAKSY